MSSTAAARTRSTGGEGNDEIAGSLDADTSGGDGSGPTFDVSHAEADRIGFGQIGANANVAGDGAFAFIGRGAFTCVAGPPRAALQPDITRLRGDVTGDGVAGFTIEFFELATPLPGERRLSSGCDGIGFARHRSCRACRSLSRATSLAGGRRSQAPSPSRPGRSRLPIRRRAFP